VLLFEENLHVCGLWVFESRMERKVFGSEERGITGD
jgi:hypothetical protein